MQATPQTEAVLEADRLRYRAMIDGDLAALDRRLADDLVYLHSKGSVDSKASFMAALRERKFAFKSATTSDTQVRVYGDVAVLHGKVAMAVEVGATVHQAHSTFSTVWLRHGGDWRLAHWQATPLPKS